MFRKTAIVVLTLVALCFTFAVHAEAGVTWKLSHHRPVDSQIDKDMKQFAADVEAQTNGRVKIQVFPAGQLGGSEAAMERVSMGAIEMMVGYPNSELDPKLDIYSMPGITKDFADVKKIYAKGSPYMNILEKTFNDLDMHVLSSYTTAFIGVSFRSMPQNIKDPNFKHTEKIRVPGINSYRYPAEAIGYIVTPLPWGEVFTALQTGVVDGVYGPAAEPNYSTLRDVIKVYMPLNIQIDMFFLLVNQDAFAKLPEQDRKIISALGTKLEESRFGKGKEEQKMWEDRLAERGISIVELTPEELEAFQKRIQEGTWDKLRKEMGTKFFDEVMAAREEALK